MPMLSKRPSPPLLRPRHLGFLPGRLAHPLRGDYRQANVEDQGQVGTFTQAGGLKY